MVVTGHAFYESLGRGKSALAIVAVDSVSLKILFCRAIFFRKFLKSRKYIVTARSGNSQVCDFTVVPRAKKIFSVNSPRLTSPVQHR